MPFRVTETTLPGVLLFTPRLFRDERGFFMETYQENEFRAAGIPFSFVQDNHSASIQGVLRGLHYQICQPQGKLVRVISGAIFDVCVDLRRSSPTFGKWTSLILSARNHQILWISPGFAHGFYTLTKKADVLYKTTDFYAPQYERTLLWNDPQVGIDWRIGNLPLPILSAKDAKGSCLSDAEVFE